MNSPNVKSLKQIPELTCPLTFLKGIGAKRAQLLAQKRLNTVLDLLFFAPVRYEDRSRILPINKSEEGLNVLVKGKVIFGREEVFRHNQKRLFRIIIKDDGGSLDLLWFHYKRVYLNRFARHGMELMAYGNIQMNRGRRQIVHPDITLMDHNKEKGGLGFYPVYPAIKGISGQTLRSVIKHALNEYRQFLTDRIPGRIIHRLGLPNLEDAIRFVHFPPKGSSITPLNQLKTKYHQRLVFDRFFFLMLNIGFRKRFREKKAGPVFSIPEEFINRLEKYFPFTLTNDQGRTVEEIFKDLKGGRPMNRLLQGDVGCGKTVVAAMASCAAVLNNWQVAIMVPTHVLARQHHEYFLSLSKEMGFRPVLLTGAMKKSDRLGAYKRIANGECDLVIGTHALIEEGLSFDRLGLVVIDEQHRFGVRQRALLDEKGVNPHLLVMTATPIPRTLAMTVYADMDISVIEEYPEGHLPVVTHLVNERQKRKVYNTIKQRMSLGQQAVVICPVIEASEETDLKDAFNMYAKLKKIFAPQFRIGLIHGRMAASEKDQVMDQFRKGQVDLLVGTTVIEVGVHSPGATVMVVEHPERFGLAQLHQLRGRVGRGDERGLFLLMQQKELQEESLLRLKVLIESNNGFEIAQKDLEMRGQGELIGVKQSGAGELDFAEILNEAELFMTAKREAERVLESDPELSHPENRFLRGMIQTKLEGRGTPPRL